MDKKITHLLGVLIFSFALLLVGGSGYTEYIEGEEIEAEVVITDIEVIEEEGTEEGTEEGVEEGTEEGTEEGDDLIGFDEFEDDFDDYAEEGDLTMIIVVLAVVALGLVVFLVTRKR